MKRPACTAPLALLFLLGAACLVSAAPLPRSDVPDPLKSWVPWVMHGHEMLACPAAYNGDPNRACVWPSRLEVHAGPDGATFRFEVQVFGAAALVELPGAPGVWPQALKVDGQALAATSRDDRPVAQLAPGSHVVSGTLRWPKIPEDLLLPRETGSLQLTLNGRVVNRTPDADGRVWLQQQSQTETQTTDAITLRTSRLIQDDIPLRVTTHYTLAISGKAREIQLPAALLPGFVAESIESPLPARLQAQGQLRLQGRPGQWTLSLRGRLMAPVNSLTLPAQQADEIWSFAARNDLRLVSVEGLPSVDPKQVPIPPEWQAYPAYRIKAGETLKFSETRRGNPQPGADRLTLARQIWLDFDGNGYTVQDAIAGNLSRSWRLELAPPGTLGRAAVDGSDQPVTRRAGAPGDGVELRRGALALRADSRVEGSERSLPATGWLADFNAASAQLHLPPGWRLLHAGGADKAEGSWVAAWTLWDFFFVLLGVLASAKLFGARAALLVGAALVLTWHMPGAPQAAWLGLLGLLALTRVLPSGSKWLTGVLWSTRLFAVAIGLWLIPYAVEQVRLSLHPSLEHPWMQVADTPRVSGGALPAAPAAAPPGEARSDVAAAEQEVRSNQLREKREILQAPRRLESKVAQASLYASSSDRLADVDPSVKVQTGPGLPAWTWNSHRIQWQGPVQAAQHLDLTLLPPAGTVLLRLTGLAFMLAALWALLRGLPGWLFRPSMPLPSWRAAPPVILLGVCVACLAGGAGEAWSASPAAPAREAQPTPRAAAGLPDAALLDALRDKLSAPATCQPACADVARLRIEAQGSRVQLRLEVHALADVMLPLPGQGANWRPTFVSVDAQPAALRRDAAGALWIVLRAGTRQVLLAADVGEAVNVEIALPMVPREVTLSAPGWALAGLDARGLASGALSLSRSASGTTAPGADADSDALPPFLHVQRILHLGQRWSVETRISRLAPSRAPVRARIALIEGEAVTDAVVRIEAGHAIVQLGAEDSASFVSTLSEAPRLQLISAREPNQIEQWRLDPSAQWHVDWSGIAPVQYVDPGSGRLMPSWQPWPGEAVQLAISKPAGTPGQTLTIDRLRLSLSPGQRATDVSSSALLRSSQGGNHRVLLPEGAEFLGLALDGVSQPIQPQGRELLLPLMPGEHTLKIDWREPRGMSWMFRSTPHGLGAAGVNATTQIRLPPERVVLALGGPRIGPAVLFWGVLVALLGIALALGRIKVTPLSALAWFLLGLGLAQTSLLGAAVIAGWFFALAARRRFALDERQHAPGAIPGESVPGAAAALDAARGNVPFQRGADRPSRLPGPAHRGQRFERGRAQLVPGPVCGFDRHRVGDVDSGARLPIADAALGALACGDDPEVGQVGVGVVRYGRLLAPKRENHASTHAEPTSAGRGGSSLSSGGDDDLDLHVGAAQGTRTAGAHRRAVLVDPGVPHGVHLGKVAHVGNHHVRGQDLRLVASRQRQAFVDALQHLLRLYGDRSAGIEWPIRRCREVDRAVVHRDLAGTRACRVACGVPADALNRRHLFSSKWVGDRFRNERTSTVPGRSKVLHR